MGEVFGELTVVAPAQPIVSNRGNGALRRDSAWLCRCSCTAEKVITADNLTQGGSHSCGSGIHKQKPGAAFRQLFRNYKKDAKDRGYVFGLTETQFNVFIHGDCYYCGAPPSNVSKASWITGVEKLIYSGIDRRNNSFGYVLSNCVSCCRACNISKRDVNEEDFIARCKTIARRFS